MIKFTTLLIGCSLALAIGAWANPEDPNKNAPKKAKTVQKQFAPRQQPAPKLHSAPNTHVQTMPPQHQNIHAKVNNNYVPKQQTRTLPAVQKNKLNKAPTLHANTSHQLPAAQLNKNVKAFSPQHQNFHATPKSSIASAQFNKNYQINGAQNWQGSNYQVFQSYRPQWHDQGYWSSHYNNLSLIGGGWYYWDGGYWYPAWGYDERAAYYPYDGPIYSGPSARPFDQVVADVQSALQQQGYYHGEVDGLLGPLTRQALAEYQRAQGLYTTETIDQPTLQSLGMG